MGLTATLFVEMAREEFRLHSDLFGGPRFAAFPLFVAAVGGVVAWFLQWTGASIDSVVAGYHALVFAFGLHTGSIGFVGRDASQNLLGDLTLLIFSGRTLPISRRRLLAVFVAKDVVYYGVLFLLPLSVAFVPAGLGGGGLAGVAAGGLLWLTATLTFLFGVSVTLAAVALTTRGASGWGAVVVLAAAVGLTVTSTVDLVAFTPYAAYAEPSLLTFLRGNALTPLLIALALATYDATQSSAARTADSSYAAWRDRLPFGDDGLVAKSLLDVHRSSGGFVKALFSGGVLFAVSAGLVSLVETITGVAPAAGLAMGAILGLTAFTTYNWLTQFDALEAYLLYPLSVPEVFRAKFRAFLLLGIPVGVLYQALAAAVLDASPVHAVVGTVLLVGLQLYLFGLTVFLAGFEPNEFLFDTVLFAAFGGACAVVLVPILLVAFVVSPVGPGLLAALVVASALVGAVGVGLYRRAVPRWERRYRAGS